jgi:hypothetical protein
MQGLELCTWQSGVIQWKNLNRQNILPPPGLPGDIEAELQVDAHPLIFMITISD